MTCGIGPLTLEEAKAAQFIDCEHRGFEATLARAVDLGGVDLIITSPLYPTEKLGAKGREGAPTRRFGGDAPEHFLWDDYRRLGDMCYNALKPGGFCILVIDGPVRTAERDIGSERSTIAFQVGEDWRWTRRSDGKRFRYVEHEVYHRLGPPGDFHPRRRSAFELTHILQRPQRGVRGYFNPWAMTQPAITAGKDWLNGTGSRMWTGKVPQGQVERKRWVRPDRRTYTTVIEASENGPIAGGRCCNDPEHPAPFTRHFATVQVRTYTRPGALVCDPFVGSGTVGQAAADHGSSFVGGDLGARARDGARWADVSRERAHIAAEEWYQRMATPMDCSNKFAVSRNL